MWRTGSRSQADLVEHLQHDLKLKSENVKKALLAVDRKDFCLVDPYFDCPQSIGYNATISAPHMHAMALEYLSDKLVAGAHVLDVGSGSGYLTVCMAKMVGSKGKAVGIEHIQDLADLSIKNIRKNHGDLSQNGTLTIIQGDGRLGYPQHAPYNAIHVGAAAKEVPPALFDQLAVGGRMVIPVGGSGGQEFVQYDKVAPDKVEKKRLFGVVYIPLTSVDEQLRR
uniref:Protein-L-isoaspartate O-methyltransferase n=1 Tax=Acrobeloides nanus TaxID=290746 RepID=A0A914CXV1_9BILA